MKPPIFSNLVKGQPCCKEADHSIFHDLFIFLVTIVVQLVEPPPPKESVSTHYCALGVLLREVESFITLYVNQVIWFANGGGACGKEIPCPILSPITLQTSFFVISLDE